MSSNENEIDKVEKLKQLLARASNRINELTSNINACKKELIESKKLNESLRNELEKANKIKDEYISLNESLKLENQSLKNSNLNINSNEESISKDEHDSIVEKQVEISVEKCKKKLSDEYNLKMEEMRKEYEEKIRIIEDNHQSQYKLLEEKLNQTEDEFKRYKIKVNKIFSEKESNSEKTSPSPSEDYQIIIKQLKDKLNATKIRIKKLISEKEEVEESFKQSNETIRNLQIEKEELLEKIKKLKEKREFIHNQHQMNINDLKNELNQQKLKYTELIEQLKVDYENKISEIKKSTKEQISTLNNTLSEYKYDLDQLTNENKELKAEIEQYKLNNENDLEVKSIERLASLQSKHENQIYRQQQEINELKENLEESERMIQLFQIQEKVLKEEIRKLENNEKLSKMNENNIVLLKNVIIKHLETGEYQLLLPAIAELLHLTPEEVKKIKMKEEKRKNSDGGGITSGLWKAFISPTKR